MDLLLFTAVGIFVLFTLRYTRSRFHKYDCLSYLSLTEWKTASNLRPEIEEKTCQRVDTLQVTRALAILVTEGLVEKRLLVEEAGKIKIHAAPEYRKILAEKRSWALKQ